MVSGPWSSAPASDEQLAHIFCGHLGSCGSHGNRDEEEGGWPDRRGLGKPEKEIEAEAGAFQVASRAGMVTRSAAAYLAPQVRELGRHKTRSGLCVQPRIERLAKTHFGSMNFGLSAKQ